MVRFWRTALLFFLLLKKKNQKLGVVQPGLVSEDQGPGTTLLVVNCEFRVFLKDTNTYLKNSVSWGSSQTHREKQEKQNLLQEERFLGFFWNREKKNKKNNRKKRFLGFFWNREKKNKKNNRARRRSSEQQSGSWGSSVFQKKKNTRTKQQGWRTPSGSSANTTSSWTRNGVFQNHSWNKKTRCGSNKKTRCVYLSNK